MKRHTGLFLLILSLAPLLISMGCGSSSTPQNPVPTLTSLSPTTVVAGSQAFSLTLTGSNFIQGSAVNFGGNAKSTTYVSATQLTAAILASDIAAAGTPSVTVINPAPGGGTSNAVTFTVTAPPITVSLAPLTPTLGLLGAQQFTATVSNTPNTAVTWSISGTGCSGATCGTIDSTGLYIAPACMISPAAVTITATSVADNTKSASTQIAVQMAGPQLGGQYAFYFNGGVNGNPGVSDGIPIVGAGTITADTGYSGNISTGIMDTVTVGNVSTNVPITGSYAMSCYGGGQMTITDANGSYLYAFTLTPTGKRGHLIRYDHSATAGVGTLAAGMLAKQDPAAFDLNKLAGNFAFGSSGTEVDGVAHVAVVGQLEADASGNISSGTMDMNFAGTVLADAALTGSWTISATTGRGSGILHAGSPISRDINLVFYPVTADEAFGVYVDYPGPPVPLLSGQMLRQVGSFSASSFNANSVISFSGMASGPSSTGNGDAAAGVLTPDGAGSITAGLWDENNNSVITSLTSLSGSYSLDGSGSGRGTLTLNLGGNNRAFTVYFAAANTAFLMDGTATAPGLNAVLGFIQPQTGAPFSDASLKGMYSLGTVRPTNGLTSTTCGGVASDGKGNIVFVTAQANYRGTSSQYQAGSLPTSIPANGRLAFAVPDSGGSEPVVVYFVSPTKSVFVDVYSTQHQPYILELEQ